jgi:hypothetical protein
MIQSAKVIFIGGSMLLALVFVSALSRNLSLGIDRSQSAPFSSARECIDPDQLGRTEAGRRALVEIRQRQSIDTFQPAQDTSYPAPDATSPPKSDPQSKPAE